MSTTVSDAVWSEARTTPGAIEAALRELLAEKHAENGGFVPARVLNMLVFVDSDYSVRDRRPAARRGALSRLAHGRALLRAAAASASNARVSDRRRRRSRGRGRARRCCARPRSVEIGERHLDDLRRRSPIPLVAQRPADAAVVAPPPPRRPPTRCSGLAQAALDRLDSTRPSGPERLASRDRACLRALRPGVRGRPRVAALDAVARARRRRRSTPRADAPRARLAQRPGPCRHSSATRRSRRCCSSAGWRRALGLEELTEPTFTERGPDEATTARRSAGARSRPGTAIELAPAGRRPSCEVPGLAGGRGSAASSGQQLRLDRGPGGLRAAPPRARRRTSSAMGAARRLARRGRHPRRGHPAGAAARSDLPTFAVEMRLGRCCL